MNTAKGSSEEERGVFEDVDAFPGTMVLNLYNSAGTRIGRWEAAAGVTDETFMDAMEALLDRRDPHRRLKLS